MRYMIYMPPNTKDLAINQTMVAYGNRQNATAFARANNSNLLRSMKHLMGTRLYSYLFCICSKDRAVCKFKHRKQLVTSTTISLQLLTFSRSKSSDLIVPFTFRMCMSDNCRPRNMIKLSSVGVLFLRSVVPWQSMRIIARYKKSIVEKNML